MDQQTSVDRSPPVTQQPTGAPQNAGDQQTTIADLRAAVHRFVEARDWYRYHTPKNLVMSIAIEVAELMEHFQWADNQAGTKQMEPNEQNASLRFQVADELADVLIYSLSFANTCGIDVSEAILTKLARNEQRFPIESQIGKRATGQE